MGRGVRGGWVGRLLVVGAALWMAGIGTAARAADLALGQADVTITAAGQALRLTHALARLEMSSSGETVLAVLITDVAIPAEVADGDERLWDVLANGGVARGLHVRLDAKGRAEDWKVLHPKVDTGCGLCSDWVAELTRSASAVKGRVYTKAPEKTNGTGWEFRGELHAEILPSWEVTAEAAATPAQRKIRQALREDGSRFNATWFSIAAMAYPEQVKKFLDAGMPPDTPSPSTGDTALLTMVAGSEMPPERLAAVKELIRRGADVNRVSRQDGSTPLSRATCCVEVVEALLDAGAKVNGPSHRPDATAARVLAESAIFNDRPEILRLLVARGYALADDAHELLEIAAGRPEAEAILRAALPAGARPAPRQVEAAPRPPRAPQTPEGARRTLAAQGLSFSVEDFWSAVRGADASAVSLFMEAGMDPNQHSEDGFTPLLLASTWSYGEDTDDRTAAALALIARGADVNAADSNGATPLVHAAQHCPVEVVQALLKAGAKTKVEARGGATPMMMAVVFGRSDVVKALLDARYDIGPEREMMLQISAGNAEIQRLLKAPAGKR